MRNIILIASKKLRGIKTIIPNEIIFKTPKINLNEIEALIFTSKYAALSLQNNPKLDSNWKQIPSYVIGKESAKTLEKLEAKIAYKGRGEGGEEFAKEIIPYLKNKKTLYLRAKKITSQLPEILLQNEINLMQVIIYESKFKPLDSKLKPKAKSILIFTSPSQYQSFKKNFKWDKTYIAIAIGKTTFNAFNKNINALISPKQNIQYCIKFAKKIRKILND